MLTPDEARAEYDLLLSRAVERILEYAAADIVRHYRPGHHVAVLVPYDVVPRTLDDRVLRRRLGERFAEFGWSLRRARRDRHGALRLSLADRSRARSTWFGGEW